MQKSLKQLIVGYDYSAAAKAAVAAAATIGQQTGASMRVMTALRGKSRSPDILEKSALLQRKDVLELMGHRGDEAPVGLEVGIEQATPVTLLIQAAQRHDADLILVGTRGQSGQEGGRPVGPDAERLARTSAWPVLLVHPDKAFPPKRILAAVDFSEASGRALEWALAMAELGDGQVDALHVLDAGSRWVGRLFGGESVDKRLEITSNAREQLVAFIHERLGNHAVTPKLRRGQPWEEIEAQLAEEDYDMLCIATIGRGAVVETLVGGTADRVIRNVNCSVMTAKPDAYRAKRGAVPGSTPA